MLCCSLEGIEKSHHFFQTSDTKELLDLRIGVGDYHLAAGLFDRLESRQDLGQIVGVHVFLVREIEDQAGSASFNLKLHRVSKGCPMEFDFDGFPLGLLTLQRSVQNDQIARDTGTRPGVRKAKNPTIDGLGHSAHDSASKGGDLAARRSLEWRGHHRVFVSSCMTGCTKTTMHCKIAISCLAAAILLGCSDKETTPDDAESGRVESRGSAARQALDDPAFQQACSETPGCSETPRFLAPGAAETIWRVIVARTPEGEISIDRIDAVDVPQGDGVPVGPLSGTHQLVGLDGSGGPVDGQRIRFPEVLNIEFQGNQGSPDEEDSGGTGSTPFIRSPPQEIDISDREVTAIGYLRALPAIETLVIQDESGKVVTSKSAPVITALDMSGVQSVSMAGFAWAQPTEGDVWPYEGNLPPYCSHVLILEGEADRELARGIAYEDLIEELIVPGPTQRAAIYGALRRMTPLLCQSVGRIAFGTIPSKTNLGGAVQQVGTADMMIINALGGYTEQRMRNSLWFRLSVMKTIIHEAGHSAEALLHVQGGDPPQDFYGDWEAPARTLASTTIDNVRIEKGMRDEWFRFVHSLEELDWALGYPDTEAGREARDGWSSMAIAESGFMSRYGSQRVWDDIADMVAWTYMTGPFLEAGWEDRWKKDLACQEMRRYQDRDLPSRLVTVYTKLMFLQDLGLVAEEDVETCMGPDIGLPIASPGFHFWHDGNHLRAFDSNLTAKIGTTDEGNWVFEMKAEGEASFSQEMYPAKLQLRIGLEPAGTPLHLVAWPRGVYKLGLFDDNNVRLRLDGARAGDFDIKDGYVLVAEASKDRIAGSVFATVAMRFGAPLPVPQTWKPPLIIRFLIEH